MGYDQWLEKPYQDACDKEATVDIYCPEQHDDDENWACDYDGEADAVVTDESSGRYWWSVTYEGECPKCGASFKVTKGDECYPDDY